MRNNSLDQRLILSTHHSPFNHFRSCIATLAIIFVKLQLQFAPYLLQHREGPNCKLLCGATMVPAQDTWFVHRSDSPVLTFLGLEFSLNEHDVAPKDLQQPSKCRTFPNPSWWTIPIAAAASDNRHVPPHTDVIRY